MTRFAALTVAAFLALTAPAGAAASWSASYPTWKRCTNGHCITLPAYWVHCAGLNWLSPRNIHIPARYRTSRRAERWCAAHIPTFNLAASWS